MNNNLLFTLLSFFTAFGAYAQSLESYAVMLSAQAKNNPASITLFWEKDASATSYSILRKSPDVNQWTSLPNNPSAADSSWTDYSIVSGQAYEYMVVKKNGTAGDKYGLVLSGVDVPLVTNRGILVLVVDTNVIVGIPDELARLEWDLLGDGWQLERISVLPTQSPSEVKTLLRNKYLQNPANTKAALILGRVPVPYSGNLFPDGHTDHQGAWPADTYYADMDDIWTDNSVNNNSGSRTQNQNIPGDGKFDQSLVPSDLELQVGRIDFFDMPTFNQDYIPLVKQYLDKNHAYRHKIFTLPYKALVDNNFGVSSYPEFFAGSAMRSFSGLVNGYSNVIYSDLIQTAQNTGNIISYGCGGGSYSSAGGIGSSANFNDSSINVVFTMLFGSYFGDWDSRNNFLRAPLAGPGKPLVNVWAGRPHIHVHQLSMDNTIGYSMLRSQNNPSQGAFYPPGNFALGVHTALMGDPTLRFHTVAPPSEISFVAGSKPDGKPKVTLSWNASAEPVDGYNIYLSRKKYGPYVKLNSSTIQGTSYENLEPVNGTNYYMVRAVKTETRSGSPYLNQSQGVFDTVSFVILGQSALLNSNDIILYPNASQGTFFVEHQNGAEMDFDLFDAAGRSVSIDTQDLNGVYRIIIDADAANGIYYLKVSFGGIGVNKKVVLQR